MRRKTLVAPAILVTALTFVSGGCLSASTSASSASAATSKDTVSIMYNFGTAQDTAFRKDLDAWASKNNIKINYIQSDQFETLIQTKVSSGEAPDIALFPQPGLLNGFAAKGLLADLGSQTDLASVKNDILPGFLDAATVNGVVYGAPVSMNVKSLYWYDKANFAAAGLTVPKTEADLEALVAKVKATGKTPICYGMESSTATGWPGTDWIEDYVLQTSGTSVYDKWVTGDVKFNSPEIKKAFDIYNTLIMTKGNVYGGADKSASVAFGTSLNPMFDKNPGCYIGKMGNFITSFFPDDVKANIDSRVGVFSTPSVSGASPVEGGGDLAAAFTKNDTNVKKVMNELVNDPTFGVNVAKSGAALSPHKSFDASNYPNDLTRQIAKLAASGSVFRFDGSDLMPAAVGAKSFWTGMVDYTTGAKTEDQVLTAIDQSWPTK